MSKPSGLIVFESADEIQIKIDNSSQVLSSTGLYWVLQDFALCLTSGVEDSVRPGFDAPLAYVQSGGVESGRKQLWFRTRDAADILIRRIEDASAEQKLEQKVSLHTPYKESFQTKIQSFIGTCATAVFVCFLGAGAANLGWKTFDPMATSLAGAHQSVDQEQAKLPQAVFDKMVAQDREASIKAMLDVQAVQQQKLDAYQRSLMMAEQADEKMKNDIHQDFESLFAQEAREEVDKQIKEIMQRQQLLPEQETQAQ
ncbi:hypothetical protein [Pseudomonas baetica]|uniref:hypothetical protein n=1 Tax=Pseudomonas baetica TaxID=674054 RepID=UPI002405B8F5|nr:hypothetical protein [Pseudomonas baetica]MDF9778996.1 hypothetical protein [Pseudomonas baetica]